METYLPHKFLNAQKTFVLTGMWHGQKDMDILDDMGVSKLSAKVFF